MKWFGIAVYGLAILTAIVLGIVVVFGVPLFLALGYLMSSYG